MQQQTSQNAFCAFACKWNVYERKHIQFKDQIFQKTLLSSSSTHKRAKNLILEHHLFRTANANPRSCSSYVWMDVVKKRSYRSNVRTIKWESPKCRCIIWSGWDVLCSELAHILCVASLNDQDAEHKHKWCSDEESQWCSHQGFRYEI